MKTAYLLGSGIAFIIAVVCIVIGYTSYGTDAGGCALSAAGASLAGGVMFIYGTTRVHTNHTNTQTPLTGQNQ